jgi:hypothetical protein
MFSPREPNDTQLADTELPDASTANLFEYEGHMLKALTRKGVWFIQELNAYLIARSGQVESQEDDEKIKRLINDKIQSMDIKVFKVDAILQQGE